MAAAVSTPEAPAVAADPRAEAIAIVKAKAAEAVEGEEAQAEEGTAPEAEKPAEPAPDPQAERVAKRIAAATRIELRAAQQRAEIQAKEHAIAAKEAELDTKIARYKRLEEDPVAAFEELKLDPKTFLEKLAGTQDPNALITKKLSSLEAELTKEREERQRLQEESLRRERLHHVNAATQQASQQFIAHIAEAADKYPHLVEEYTPDEIVARGMRVAEQHAEAYKTQFGIYPDDEVIAQYLEEEAAARFQAKTAWRERIGKRADKPGQGDHGETENGQSVKAATPRTLTSKSAAQKASAPKPWNESDAREEAKRIIRKLHEAE